MSKTFIGSDFHFNHNKIIEYSGRPFANVTEMNETMIERWNAKVKPADTVIVNGDFAFPWKQDGHVTYGELAARLTGRKILIVGNHDKETMKDGEGGKARDHWMWDEVYDYLEFKFGKSRFVICHYPFETWRNAHHGWYHLHGHCHGNLKRVIPHRMDIGVDCSPDYAPFLLEDIRTMLEAQPDYDPQDHHGD